MATKTDVARGERGNLENGEEGQQHINTLDQILDISSGRFGKKRNLSVPKDVATCSKKFRDEDEEYKCYIDDEGEFVSENRESPQDEVQLSECIVMFPKKKLSQHGNVFEGEIRSGVYGLRSCVIKFAEISEQNVREAKILTKLGSHTNVIAIVQSGTYSDILEDQFYIALDKCHEENLRQYLSKRRNAGMEFDIEQANDFAHQIIDGVAYIHDNKVVHLDLKPSNILLSLNLRLIKIADFGLSRELKSTSSKFHLNGQFGTDGYRPVESFGDGWVSLRSDIFSLGAVFYHLLSNGEDVFGDDEHKYIYNVNNNVKNMSHLLVSNPKTAEHLIKSMLSNERCSRPTIWQVSEHPCWTGRDVECNFDYGYGEEIDDSEVQILESKNDDSDSDTGEENQLKLAQAWKQMEIMRPPVRKSSIIIFDGNSQRLQHYNSRNQTVTQMHEFPDKMIDDDFTPVSIGDHIYVLMDRLMYRIKYCDVTATWERMADLIEDHGSFPPAVVASRSIILAGGSDSTYTKSVTRYDSALNQWEKVKDKQLETKDPAIVASRGFLYCLGGRIEAIGATNRVERMNVVPQTWEEVTSMKEARHEASALEYGGNLFVAGGWGRDSEKLNSVEKYDPTADQWSILKPMSVERRLFQCHLIDGNIYAVGPSRRGIEKYDVEKDEWEFVQIPKHKNLNIYESVTVRMRK